MEEFRKRELLYVLDMNEMKEIIAEHIQYDECEYADSGVQISSVTTKHEVKPIIILPLGHLIAEIISWDDGELRDELREKIKSGSYETLITPEPFEFFGHIEIDAQIFLLNCVVSVREYVNLCYKTTRINRTVWKNGLFEAMSAYDWLPEYSCNIKTHEFVDGWAWEETFESKNSSGIDIRFDPGSLDSIDFDVTKLPMFLQFYAEAEASEENEISEYPLHGYTLNDPVSLLLASLDSCVMGDIKITKCGNCGMYFVPNRRSDTIYCDRQAPQDIAKTCKEYGARQAWKRTLKESESAGLYRNIYMAKQMLAKRNPDIPAYQETFEWFKAESKRWKAEIKTGNKTEGEFLAWLREVKERKVL